MSASASSISGYGNHDPDDPLPSIERDITPTSVGNGNSLNSPIYTPSGSPGIISESAGYESLNGRLQSLRVGSLTPQASSSSSANFTVQERSDASPSPSIRITPTASRSLTDNGETEDLVEGVGALEIGHSHQPSQSPEPNGLLGHASTATATTRQSLNASRRRRSGSGAHRLAAHKVEDEEPPQVPFYDKVPEVLTTGREITARLAQCLSMSNLHQEQGSSIQTYYQTATRLCTFEPSSVHVVGLVGESGVGKSSLINSLLDRAEFTRSSNSGTACTCVVTEYHFHDRDDYAIVIDYFKIDDLKTQFKELLTAYRQYMTLESQRESPELQGRENYRDLKKTADLAICTFRASFRSKLDDHPEVLDIRQDFDNVIDTMMGWVEQVLPPVLPTQGTSTRESFSDINECSDRLRVLASETDEVIGQPACPWPFIKRLKVYLRAHILSRGLVLVDLPGLRDLNYARQKVTERYIRECNHVFVVTWIGRAESQEGVSEVFELARRAQLRNLSVICTQSDKNIRVNEVKQDPLHNDERDRIEQMEEDIKDQNDIIASLQQDYNDYRTTIAESGRGPNLIEYQVLDEIQQDNDRATETLNELQFQLDHYIINLRNQKTARDLKNKYSSYQRDGDLKIFCISNTMYWEARDKPAQKALPFLKLSGILELRRYCIGMVAQNHLRETNEYIKHDIPALLNSVKFWVDASLGDVNAERKQKVLRIVSTIQQELDEFTSPVSQINDISRKLVEKFENQLGQYMRSRVQQWSDSAGQASKLWESFHHGSYAAFCRHYGTHKTEAVEYRCWNEEAISSMTDEMSGVWNAFTSNVMSYLDQYYESVGEVFDHVLTVTRTRESDRNLQTVLNSLTAILIHRRTLLLYETDNIVDDFQEKEMSTVQTDSLSPIRTSIVGQIMEDAYSRASMKSGRGRHDEQKKIISSAFGSLALFNNHRRRSKEQFLAISNTLQQKLRDAVDKHFSLIGDDLATLRNENAVQESETTPRFRTGLEAEVARAREDLRKAREAIGYHEAVDSVLGDT